VGSNFKYTKKIHAKIDPCEKRALEDYLSDLLQKRKTSVEIYSQLFFLSPHERIHEQP
jgi:hypothetical protein